MNQEELWKKIEDFPKYEVSNRGKMMEATMRSNGYFVVELSREDQKRKGFPVHNLVAKYFIDNPNRDLRNNNVENLRWETAQQTNMRQKIQQNRKIEKLSNYKGVSLRRRDSKWIAYIRIDGKLIQLGSFDMEVQAARAYDEAAKKYFGEFARLNFEKYNDYNGGDNQCEKQKTSIYKGVTFNKNMLKWGAQIRINKKNNHLGYFDTELEAAKVYDEAAKKYLGEMTVLNLKEDESNKIEIKQKSKIQKSSIYKGVTFHKQAQKWQAYISFNQKQKSLGLFKTELKAARAYDKAAKELHKECAKLNFKDEEELTEQLANLNINEGKQE